ncbi:MAG: hypothetical protein ACR2M1_15575 [Gemmatimonadaceae bacterium]
MTQSVTPVVSWAPACDLSVIVIYPTSPVPVNTNVVWDVATYGRNIIRPSVQYGVDPFAGVRGDTLPAPTVPKPLVPGRTYHLVLFRAALDGSGQGLGADDSFFTPPLPARTSARDPGPGSYIQLPPPGKTFPYYSGDKQIGNLHADTINVYPDLTYQSSGATMGSVATPRAAFTRVGVDSLYFPRIASLLIDMYARVHGDTLVFESDTVSMMVHYTTVYIASSTDEAERAIGLDFFPEGGGPGEGHAGLTLPHGIVLVGNPLIGEAYLREFVHVILSPAFPSANGIFAEGVATWLGGSQGRTPREMYALLRRYQKADPTVTLAALLKNDPAVGPAREQTDALYATGALVVDTVYARAGISGLRELAHRPRSGCTRPLVAGRARTC